MINAFFRRITYPFILHLPPYHRRLQACDVSRLKYKFDDLPPFSCIYTSTTTPPLSLNELSADTIICLQGLERTWLVRCITASFQRAAFISCASATATTRAAEPEGKGPRTRSKVAKTSTRTPKEEHAKTTRRARVNTHDKKRLKVSVLIVQHGTPPAHTCCVERCQQFLNFQVKCASTARQHHTHTPGRRR